VKYLGIDIGTTRTKAVLYDDDTATVIADAAAPTPTARTPLGDVHVPDAILATVTAVVDELMGLIAPARRRDTAALAVASVGEEVVLVDRTGTGVDDVIAWYNPLGQDAAAELLARLGGQLPWPSRPDPSFSLFKLAWLARHRGETLRRAAALTDLGSHVTAQLAGLDPGAYLMDWSHASRTGLFDVAHRQWSPAAAGVVGLSTERLPRLVPSGTVAGTLRPDLAARWGLPGDLAVCTGGHDHLCGAYACDVRAPGEIFLSAGTSEAQVLLTETPPRPPPDTVVDIGCFVDDRHFYLHRALPSGHLFRQWRDLLYPGVDDETLYREVAAAPDGSMGIEARIDVASWRLSIGHVPTTAERGTLMRALQEGLAALSGQIGEELAILAGTPVRRVVAAGAPVHQPVWRQLRAAVSPRPLAFATATEPSATGAALLARRALNPYPPRPQESTPDAPRPHR
jgi:xylulokinase